MNAFIESTLRLMRHVHPHAISADDDTSDAVLGEVLSLGALRGEPPGRPSPAHMDPHELAEVENEVRGHVVTRMACSGVTAAPASILLASSRARALSTALHAIGVDPQTPIAVENPTSPAVLAMLGSRCIGVGRGPAGLDFVSLDRAFQRGARVFYTTATGHDPSGATLSAADRAIVLALARRHDAWVVDDDGNGDIAYAPAPPPLVGLSGPSDRVVHIGGHGNLLAPIPTGAWLLLPPGAERGGAWTQAPHERMEAAVAWDRFFRRFGVGAFQLRIAHTLHSLRTRRAALLTALEVYIGDAATWIAPEAGASLLLRPTQRVSSHALAAESRRRGVLVEPAARCFVGGDDGGSLQLSFANLDGSCMGTAVWRLAAALAAVRGSAG